MREKADSLTIAYVAIGVHIALMNDKDEHLASALADRYSGQIGIIEEVIQHAVILDTLADMFSEEMNGCFAYEVAEPFGKAYTEKLLSDEPPNPHKLALELMADLVE